MSEHSKQVKSAGRPKPPAAGIGRKKGTPNKTTALLKDAIIMAAEATGLDMNGKEGLIGYCKFLAMNEPKAFASLMGRVLPTQIEGRGENGEIIINVVRFADDRK